VLPTHFSEVWLGLLATPIQLYDAVEGTISAVGYATGFR
jgi:ABC-2 type transport system permease protein